MIDYLIDSLNTSPTNDIQKIKYILFTHQLENESEDASSVKIHCEQYIQSLCDDHELIRTLICDCQNDTNKETLTVLIPEGIYFDQDTINFILQTEDLSVPTKFKSIYGVPLLADYFMSSPKILDNVKSFIKNYVACDCDCKAPLLENTISNEDKIYLAAIYFKFFDEIHYKIYNQIDLNNINIKYYDTLFRCDNICVCGLSNKIFKNECKECSKISEENIDISCFDSKFIAYLSYMFYERRPLFVIIPANENVFTKKTNMVKQRFDQMFGDLLKGIKFTNKYKETVFVISGGSINIALDSTIDIEKVQTDLDIFLLRSEEVQKQTVKYLLEFFVEKYGYDNIYMCEAPSIKYLWIVGTPYHVQIIGTSYMEPYELVNCFDLTHVRCWYNGLYFCKTLDCDISIRTKVSYCVSIPLKKVRLYKTLKRGYKVVPLIYNRNNNNPDDLLKTYDLNNVKSDEVDRYLYVLDNHIELFPKGIDTRFTIKKNLSFMVNKRCSDIMDFINCESNYLDIIDKISNRHKISYDAMESYTNIDLITDSSNNNQKTYNWELLASTKYKVENIVLNDNRNYTHVLECFDNNISNLLDKNQEKIKVNIGNNIISNIIFNYKLKYDECSALKVILMIKDKKYGIYMMMVKILEKIREMFNYDISEVEVGRSFVNQPNDIENNYKKYIGDYLVCWDYSLRSSQNHLEFSIGQMLNAYLSFSIEHDDKNVVKYIHPILNFDQVYQYPDKYSIPISHQLNKTLFSLPQTDRLVD